MKNENGVTLVALILLFLVLILLAGLSVSLVISEKNSQEETELLSNPVNTSITNEVENVVTETNNSVVSNEVDNAVVEPEN